VDGNEMHRGLTDRDAMVRLRDVEQAVRERVAVNYKGWEHDRDELVSVVLGKYFTKFGRGPGPDNLHAWLKPVIRNAGVDLDRKAPEDLLVDDDDDLDFVEVLGVVHSGASYVGVKADVWRRAFALICEEQRELLDLKYFDGMGAADIAMRRGISVDAAHKAVQRARKAFTAALAQEPELADELRRPHPKIY